MSQNSSEENHETAERDRLGSEDTTFSTTQQTLSSSTAAQEVSFSFETSPIPGPSSYNDEFDVEKYNYEELLNRELISIQSSLNIDEERADIFDYDNSTVFDEILNRNFHTLENCSFTTNENAQFSISNSPQFATTDATAVINQVTVTKEMQYNISDEKFEEEQHNPKCNFDQNTNFQMSPEVQINRKEQVNLESNSVLEVSSYDNEICVEKYDCSEQLNSESTNAFSSLNISEQTAGTFDYYNCSNIVDELLNRAFHTLENCSFTTNENAQISSSNKSQLTKTYENLSSSEAIVNREMGYNISAGKSEEERNYFKWNYSRERFGSKGKKAALNEEPNIYTPVEKCGGNVSSEIFPEVQFSRRRQNNLEYDDESMYFSLTLQPSLNVQQINDCTTSRETLKNMGDRRQSKLSKLQIDRLPGMSGRVSESKDLRSTSSHSQSSANISQCGDCEMSFVTDRNLREHIQLHSNEEVYKCDLCNIVFTSEILLHQHVCKRADETPTICEEYDSRLQTKSTLNQPELTKDAKEDLKCKECSKIFKFRKTLRSHMLIHGNQRPHQCYRCPKTFRRKDHLTEHMLIHSVERPFSCNICSKTFKRKSHLSSHTPLHASDCPFVCNECPKAYKTKYSLRKHKSTHSAKKP